MNTEGNTSVTLTHIANASGNFKGLYSFTNVPNGTVPEIPNWDIFESIPIISVLNDVNGNTTHYKVLRFHDTGGTSDYGSITNTITGNESGTVEFWIRTEQTNKNARFVLKSTSTDGIRGILSEKGQIFFLNETGEQVNVTSYVVNQWYHIQIDFECDDGNYTGLDADTFRVYVNQVSYGIFNFYNALDAIDQCYISTYNAIEGYALTFFIDALDYSWASGYYLHRNMDQDQSDLFNQEGSYCSPILAVNDAFLYNLTTYCNVPAGSYVYVYFYLSFNGGAWTPYLGAPNCTVNTPLNGNWEMFLCYNFTSNGIVTSTIFGFDVYYRDEVLNELPSFANISPANNSLALNLNVPINCTILDTDLDLLNVSLYINDTLVNGASDCVNGTFFCYLFLGNYNTTYTFYFNVTDGENITLSDLYLFSTEEMPNELPQIGDVSVSFDNETLEATISVLVTDPDNDTLSVFLCLPLGTIVANQTSIINGTIIEFVVLCEYDSAYEYYINVTDSEDSVQSSLFGFTTGAEPEEPPEESANFTSLLIAFTFSAICLLIIAKMPSKKLF